MVQTKERLYRHKFSDFPLDCVATKVQEILEGLKLNGTRKRLVYGDNANLLDGTMNTIKIVGTLFAVRKFV
jgi:hypothetical protein